MSADHVTFASTLEKQHKCTLATWDICFDWSWCCAPPANQQMFIMSAQKLHAESCWAHYTKTLQSSESSTNEILVGHTDTTQQHTRTHRSIDQLAPLQALGSSMCLSSSISCSSCLTSASVLDINSGSFYSSMYHESHHFHHHQCWHGIWNVLSLRYDYCLKVG